MKYALFNNNRIEATKGIKGICPSCGSELIAKCGEVRVNYWAHKKSSNCDPWWENETNWHRSWKNNFPDTWQEIPLFDKQTGEKHIADIYTNYNLVIEFQHSHIDPQERISRENFYKNMVWIVDGTRLKRDYPRFLRGKADLRRTTVQGYFFVDFPDECFPSSWLGSLFPVIFDFRGTELLDDSNDLRNHLYCLLPQQSKGATILVVISRESFINNTITGELFKQQQESQNPTVEQAPDKKIFVKRRESQFVVERGRISKRWRF